MILNALLTFQLYYTLYDFTLHKFQNDIGYHLIQKLDIIFKFRRQGSNVETYVLWCLVVS